MERKLVFSVLDISYTYREIALSVRVIDFFLLKYHIFRSSSLLKNVTAQQFRDDFQNTFVFLILHKIVNFDLMRKADNHKISHYFSFHYRSFAQMTYRFYFEIKSQTYKL